MASLADLARERTDLGDRAIATLQSLVGEWTLLADLGFADLVLWLPTWNTGGFVAAAQVRPTTGPTRLPDDIVGTFVPRGRNATIDRAASTRLPALQRHPGLPGVPTGDEAFPVVLDGMLAAVIERRSGVDPRGDGPLERTYAEAFDALIGMACAGDLPTIDTDDESVTDSPPRVGDGLIRLDASGTVSFASPNAQSAVHRIGITREITGTVLRDVLARLLERTGTTNDALLAVVRGRTAGEAELDHRGAAVTFRGIPLRRDGSGIGALVLVRDVSDLRRRERALLTKDATIREIHHRVKNNLQTVASLLRLQARRSSSPEVRAELEEAVRRVGAIAIVHESLAHEPGVDVDFDEVIDRVIAMSRDMLPGHGTIEREGETGALASERATSLAMVLAELIGNGVEHGLGGRAGAGLVRVRIERNGRLIIHVDDDGPGMGAAGEGLGLSIVRSLVTGELRGSLAIRPGPLGGTRATVDLPR